MPTSKPVGDLADAVVEHRVARDPQHTVLLALPPQREADDVADDRMAQRWTVPARRRGDVDGWRVPGALQLRRRPSHAAHARCRRAGGHPTAVVTTTSADGSSCGRRRRGCRHGARASAAPRRWAPSSPAAIAGPVTFRDDVPQPKSYVRPGGSNVGSVSIRQPADLDQHGRPADVGDLTVVSSRARSTRPVATSRGSTAHCRREVGDLLPTVPAPASGAAALVLLVLR